MHTAGSSSTPLATLFVFQAPIFKDAREREREGEKVGLGFFFIYLFQRRN